MIVPSSEAHPRRPVTPGACAGVPLPRALQGEAGAVLAIVVLALLVLLGSAGLAVDLGRGYVVQLRLSRAVDAGALAGARALRGGQEVARSQAESMARANGIAHGAGGVTTDIHFGTNDRGENTVRFSAHRVLPTTFMRALGIFELPVRAEAEAAVPPLDIVLVLDTSGSLGPGQGDVFPELQAAATTFVSLFSDQVDQMGMVTFQLTATTAFPLRHNFRIQTIQAIHGMAPAGDTNIQEGLQRALEQLNGPYARPSAAKVVVFFTDGRATAVRGTFGGQDRILAVYTTPGSPPRIRGFFNHPQSIPPFQVMFPSGHGQANWPGGCPDVPTCFGLNQGNVRDLATQQGLAVAQQIRQQGFLIYSIGLGNHQIYPPGDIRGPDEEYLRQIANEGGVMSPSEPQGRMFFAPTGAELEAVFAEVARDLIVRLAS